MFSDLDSGRTLHYTQARPLGPLFPSPSLTVTWHDFTVKSRNVHSAAVLINDSTGAPVTEELQLIPERSSFSAASSRSPKTNLNWNLLDVSFSGEGSHVPLRFPRTV